MKQISVLAAAIALGALAAAGCGKSSSGGVPATPQAMSNLKDQMKQLGVQFAQFEEKNKHYPAEWELVTWLSEHQASGDRVGRSFLLCPICNAPVHFFPASSGVTWESDYGSPYTCPVTGINDAAPPDLPVAWCLGDAGNHDPVVLFFQGRVDTFATDRGAAPPAKPGMVAKLRALEKK